MDTRHYLPASRRRLALIFAGLILALVIIFPQIALWLPEALL